MKDFQFPGIFTILKPAIGPSSSHTLGPLLAATDFRRQVLAAGYGTGRLQADLKGSLALTGKGHLTDLAVTAGLAGYDLQAAGRHRLQDFCQLVRQSGTVAAGPARFAFVPEKDIRFIEDRESLPHPNTMIFYYFGDDGAELLRQEYYSIGGGRLAGGSFPPLRQEEPACGRLRMSHVVDFCLENGQDLATLVLQQEEKLNGLENHQITSRLLNLWEIMGNSVERGLQTEGILPGRLKLERRAAEMFRNYQKTIRQWRVLSREITLAEIYAIAVAEENASGGQVVTTPTCGSAGILPAILRMLQDRFQLSDEKILRALMVAGLVGAIIAENGSISGAEVGCQGEVGSASAMAAAAACYLLGGTVLQVETAAETALEHHLGLTCDPVYGLVQIPCIERNAVGAVTALNAANLALLSSGRHRVSFDVVVDTMMAVGRDMHVKYKETALGGLARARTGVPSGLPRHE